MNNLISDRILLIMKEFNLNKNSFSKAIGLSNNVTIGNIINEKREPGFQILSKIILTFDSINANWLLTGKGEMYNTLGNTIKNTAFTRIANSKNIHLSALENTHILSPNQQERLSPTLSPTTSLGLPKVVTIGENDRELISLVPHKASAGYLNGYSDPEYVESLPTIRLPNLGNGTHRAFEIKGHSMNPTLYNGSMSIGRWVESLDDIRDRRIYIIVTKSEGIVTKRVLNRVSESGKLILISDNQNKKDYPNIILDASDVLELWYQRANLAFEFPEPDILYNRVNDLEAKVTLIMDQLQKSLK